MIDRSALLARIDRALQKFFLRCPRIPFPLILAFLAGVGLCVVVAHGETDAASTASTSAFTGLCAGEPDHRPAVIGVCEVRGLELQAGRLRLSGDALTVVMSAYPAFIAGPSNQHREYRVRFVNTPLYAPSLDLYLEGLGWIVVTPRSPELQAALAAGTDVHGFYTLAGTTAVDVAVDNLGTVTCTLTGLPVSR